MQWRFSDDVDAFVAAVGPWLRRDPAANTVLLTAAAEYRAGHRWSANPPLFGWCARDVRAAVCRFPPYELALSAMSNDDAAALVDALTGYHVPSVRGPVQTVDAFTARWVQHHGATPEAGRRQRLYRLTRLHRPPRPASGTGRPAEVVDVPVILQWLDRFAAEAGSVQVDRTAWVLSSVRSGLVWLWHDDAPVAVACRHATVESASRVGPVYTPPEQRGRGYGSAVTAAVTADALAAGADQTVLFADLGNPTANAIYTALGYRPVHDVRSVHFSVPS